MPTIGFVNHLQPKAGRQDELVELLRQFADSIHAEDENLHYSVHRAIGDSDGPVTVIQMYSTVAGITAHGAWMSTQMARLLALLESPPEPPVLLEQIELDGDVRERFSAEGEFSDR